MRGLDVCLKAVLVKPLGSYRADRCNQHFRKAAAHRVFVVHFSSDLEEVVYLYPRRKQDDVEFIARTRRDRGTQWFNIFRQAPFIHEDAGYLRAAIGKAT